MRKDDDTSSNFLVHMYNCVVVGVVRSTSMLLRMHSMPKKNPRAKDVQAVYDALMPTNQRLFFDFIVAIAEFTAYRTLDFVESYNQFDAEKNADEFPRVSLVYSEIDNENIRNTTISTFGTDNLGRRFSEIAKDPEVRGLVDNTIQAILDSTTRLGNENGGETKTKT